MKRVLLLVIAVLCLWACKKAPEEIAVTSVTLSQATAEMIEGETAKLIATVLPSDATDKKVIWASSKQSVATVSNTGLVSAIAEGTSIITASAGGKSATCTVTVSKKVIVVSSVELNKKDLSLERGKSETLIATVKPDDAADKTVTWSSSDERIVSVEQTGKVTAIQGGNAIITANAGDKSAKCVVTVTVPVTDITLSQTSLALEVGQTASLTATVSPSDATDKTVTWTSSNTSVATVSNGMVTAKAAGTASITASVRGKSATCSVTVTRPSNKPAEAVDLGLPSGVKWASYNLGAIKPEEYGDYYAWGETSPKNDYLWETYKWCIGSSTTLTNLIKYNTSSRYGTVDNKTQLELSDDAAHANWGGNWRMPTKAEFDELKSNCTYTWITRDGVKGYQVTSKKNGNSIFLPAGGYWYGAYVNHAGSDGVYWSSSLNKDYPDNAWRLDFQSSLFITNSFNRSYGLSVRPVIDNRDLVEVSSVTLSQTSLTLEVGQTATLTATVKPDNATDKDVTWSSSNTTIATVSNGTVTAKAEGTATITAKAGDKSATCTVTVKKASIAVTSITLSQTTLSLEVGQTATLTATVKPDNATDKTVTWTSSNTSIATVSNGTVTAKAEGTATITAKAGDKSATCTVTVKKASIAVTSVTLSQTTLSLEVGQTATLTATVKPDNATDKTVTWTSSNTSIATVSNGTVTAKAEGTATITAKAGDKSATCTVTVKKAYVAVTSVTLNKTSLSLTKGSSETLTATVSPSNATDKTVTWTSSNTSIATVSNGLVTAKAEGTATITASAGGKSATCAVTVTQSSSNGPKAVDLGLPSGIKWASYNVGATKPEEYGDYFAWGETKPKNDYSWSTYKWCNGSNTTLTKYNISSGYGTVDYKTQLEMSDDAARVNLGGKWRMPTNAEFEELIDNCDSEWATMNGVKGRKFTSKKNGNSIFLPAAGFWYDTYLNYVGSYGSYWSSSLYTDFRAWYVFFISDFVSRRSYDRYYGLSVRPVYGDLISVTSVILSQTTLSLEVGQTATLTATVKPDNATDKTVTWTSSNTSIATIYNGLVTAKAEGTATITASAGGKSATCTVTVTNPSTPQPQAIDLGLSVKWASFNLGASFPSDYGDYYAWGELTTKSYYGWSNYKWCKGTETSLTKYNSSSSYGTVDNKSVLDLSDDVAYVKLGGDWRMPSSAELDELIATRGNSNYKWTWKSINGHNGWEVVYQSNGQSIFLPAAGRWVESKVERDNSYGYFWCTSLSSPSIARHLDILSTSVYRGYDHRYQGMSIRPVCTNTDYISVTSVSLSQTTLSLEVGQTATLTATVKPDNATDKTVTWTSSNTSIATVSNGTVTAKAEGTATITAKAGDKSATCTVTVKKAYVAVTSVTLNKTSLSLTKGSSETLTATVSPSNATDKTVTWTSSNTSIATVSNGFVTAKAEGTATITASVGGKSATCRVTVTQSSSNGPEAVDLGLPSGIKWASYNVGATKPEEYGDYFAWGETAPKSDYSWATYKWCNGSYYTLTRYCPSGKTNDWGGSGSPDNKISLADYDYEDDAARANWGGTWRMPTNAEFEELINNCNSEWTTLNGVKGRKFTSKKNGNSIFMPAAGYRNDTNLSNVGSGGYYWSSSLNTDYPDYAWRVGFNSDNVYRSYIYRYLGRSVRPVSE